MGQWHGAWRQDSSWVSFFVNGIVAEQLNSRNEHGTVMPPSTRSMMSQRVLAGSAHKLQLYSALVRRSEHVMWPFAHCRQK